MGESEIFIMKEIICILDKSGSMAACKEDAIGGFTSFIDKMKEKHPDANITVVWFDDTYEIEYEGPVLKYEPPLTWPTCGMTALLDVIGKTFNHVNPRFSKEKPEKVVMAILTDGFENASKEFNTTIINDLITEHKNKYGWEVIFLAADQDAWDTARFLGIDRNQTFSYSSSDTIKGFDIYTQAVMESLS